MKKDRRSAHGLTVEDDADARYRATFHQAAIGVAHTAPDGALLDANPALLAMLGYSRREMLTRRLVDLLLRRERRAVVGSLHPHADVKRLLCGDIGAHACIEQYRHRDGSAVWVQRTASLASDADGKPYLIHFIENITERRLTEERQRAAELRYQRTLESALDCIVSTDHLGRIVEFNPMAEKVFGYARADVLGRKLSEVLVPPPLRRRHEASMARLVAGDEGSMLNRRIETIALKADGGTIPVELMMQRITDADPPLFTGFLRDITERKEAEARILRLNRLYRILSHTSALIVRAPDTAALFKGICRIAREHGGFVRPWVGLVDAKSGAVRLAARAADDAEESPRILLDPAHANAGPVAAAIRAARVVVVNDAVHDPLTAAQHERLQKQGVKSLAVLPLQTSGRVVGVFVLKSSVQGYFDEDIRQLLREMSDELTYALDRLHLEQKHQEAEQRLAHLAHYDQLTGLPNRGLLYERLLRGIAQAARHGWTLAVLFIDLDRFKTVNDTVGHTLGNELLRQVSARLTECVRAEDTASRLSGDEFAVVLANLAHAGDAALVAAKILGRLKQPYVVEGLQVVVSASIGMTLYPQDGADADILMRNADVAMHNAKSRGRDNYQFYTADMNARARARLELENRLRGALDRDEFLLHYQPKVDIESGKICGFEALLRWQPRDGPLVSPVEFIPLLEETGLTRPVGDWVLRAACGQIAAWRKEGCEPVPVAINLSAHQLRHAGFCERAASALREAGVEPRLIEVEITESSLMENPDEAHKTLDELKAVGFTLAIDDFGTGYSSLAYLKRFPFDTLKIDRSFVSDIETNADDATIARTIIALAGSLSLTVVAEGVENEQQLAFLVANRCDQAQGYLFSRPVPAEHATALLKSGAPLHAPAVRAARSAIPAVLVVDAERERLVHVQQLLQRGGYQVLTASGLADALDVVANQGVLVVIVDQSIGDARCAEFLRRVAGIDPQVCRIMVGPTVGPRAVSEAARDGTIHRFFVRGRDDQLLRDEVRKMTRRSPQGPALVRALTRKAVWGLNLRGQRKKKSWDAEDPARKRGKN